MNKTIYFQRIFVYYLGRMITIMDKFHNAGCADFEQCLMRRLSEDMFPMWQQFTTAASFSMRACCWLQNAELIKFERQELTVASIIGELKKVLNYVNTLNANNFVGWEENVIDVCIGQKEYKLTGRELIELYALPNFFFHMSMGYAILRTNGFEIGKHDFDGLHIYEKEMSVESNVTENS